MKRKSTRLNGVKDRILLTFYYLPMVKKKKIELYILYYILISFIDKTIKLWKVFDKSLKLVTENSIAPNPAPVNTLRLPTLTHHDTIVAAVPRKVYANGKFLLFPIIHSTNISIAHTYHINSISINSDGETYISADDLRVNLWNLDVSDQSFSKLTKFLCIPCTYSLQTLLILNLQTWKN